MKLPKLNDFKLKGKRVLVRVDYDVPLLLINDKVAVADETRIKNSLPTIQYLLKQKAKIILLAHLGRPKGEVIKNLSVEPAAQVLSKLLGFENVKKEDGWQIGEDIFLKENLRFDPGEKKNSPKFARKLASLGDFYVNDAFAVSHRKHASVVSLPKLLPHAAGACLLNEIETLTRLREKPKRPVIVVLGGVKRGKVEVLQGLLAWADRILVGGRLVEYLQAKRLANHHEKLATLDKSGEDVTLGSVREFIEEIGKAGTIVWSGPLGKVEEEKHEKGTKLFAQAMIKSRAFKVIGGGDTEAVLSRFGLIDKIDFVSSGGGACLTYLASGDLPGLEALRK